MRTSECRGKNCGAPIIWCRTARGKKMPLDAEPSSAGSFVIEHADSNDPLARRLANYAASSYTGDKYTPHWETCPNSKDFGRHKRDENPA